MLELKDALLRPELINLSNENALIFLNDLTKTSPRLSMTQSEIFDAIDMDEFQALTDGDKASIAMVLSFQIINPFGKEADLFSRIFPAVQPPANGKTLAALIATRTFPITYARWLNETQGFDIQTPVRLGHIEHARN